MIFHLIHVVKFTWAINRETETDLFYLFLCSITITGALQGKEYYVAPDGRADSPGTKEQPWDIISTLSGKQNVNPGDTIWLRGGVYRYPERDSSGAFSVRLNGDENAPIDVRAMPGERVTIDGGLHVGKPASNFRMWNLEITVSEVRGWDRTVEEPGSHPDRDRPAGGLQIYSGKNCKFINLVVHDNFSSGVGFWKSAADSELHGCLIYDNGWIAPDRYHGPGIYTQNRFPFRCRILTGQPGGNSVRSSWFGAPRLPRRTERPIS